MRNLRSAYAWLGAFFLLLPVLARAQITIDFVYNGTNTVVTYQVAAGSLSSLTSSGTSSTADEHNVRNGGLVNVTAATMDTYINPGFSNSAWGTPSVAATSFSGDPIRFFQGSSGVRVPVGFDRATGTLAGSMTWSGLSLVDLGFASNSAASGSFAALGTTVNWSATTSAIPEPSTLATLLLGLAALGGSRFASRRRRRGMETQSR
jgi:hypothetical protein